MEGSSGVRKGAWSKVEDDLLIACVRQYGEGKWHLVPPRAGLNRCRKSCRLRWLNYLKPSIKRGQFSEDEVDMMKRLHRLLGNRWSLIAGRLPGRTPNDVKNYWNTNVRKKASSHKEETIDAKPKELPAPVMKPHTVIKPQTRTLSKTYSPYSLRKWFHSEDHHHHHQGGGCGTTQCHVPQPCAAPSLSPDQRNNNNNDDDNGSKDKWWGSTTTAMEGNGGGIGSNPPDNGPAGNQEWKRLLEDFNLDEELSDFIDNDQSWGDFFLDVNLWDSS